MPAFDNPFDGPGQWYRANLHAHSTVSDGKLSPQEVALHYRRQGYQVLGLTDHGRITACEELCAPDFLCLEGVELGVGRSETVSSYHVVGVGLGTAELSPEPAGPQDALDIIVQRGGVGFIAHPYWSCLVAADLCGLRNCLGLEVYNYGCEIEIAKGLSSVHWDDLLVRGEHYLALGVDDGHRCGWDFYGGFTMIRAESLTREAVMQALRRGRFYASSGPLIHHMGVTAETITVECTPAAAIQFVADNQRGWCALRERGPLLTGARYLRGAADRYVRVEIVDEAGRRAWSQPVWKEEA